MQIFSDKKNIPDQLRFMRRCGYGLHTGGRERSYVRRFGRDLYPRFHAYVEDRGEKVVINLHLDQRAPVYRGVTAHSGEYDGEVVESEADRIKGYLGK